MMRAAPARGRERRLNLRNAAILVAREVLMSEPIKVFWQPH
jgi:hypothetical protein